MGQKQNAFYIFLSLTRGNWRNALYVECKNKCRPDCKGYFFVSDTEGVPMLYPVSVFEKKTNMLIDKSECCGILGRQAFEAAYNRWLIWNVEDKSRCGIEQAMTKLPYDMS